MERAQAQAWRVVEHLRHGTDLQDEYPRLVYEAYVILNGASSFRGKISLGDLDAFFHDLLRLTQSKSFTEITRTKLNRAIHFHLLHGEADYEFYCRIGKAVGFREGFKIGYGEAIPFGSLPMALQDHITPEEPSGSTATKISGGALRQNSESWYLHVTVSTIGRMKAVETAEVELERSLSALELVSGTGEFMQGFVPHNKLDFYLLEGNEPTHFERFDVDGSTVNVASLGSKKSFDALEALNAIMRRKSHSELEERILVALDTFGMIDQATPLNSKFLLKVIALEGLLLSQDDRDYLGYRLSEKVAFLLGDNPYWMALASGKLPYPFFLTNLFDTLPREFVEKNRSASRRTLQKEMTRLYGLRSSFAHSGGRNRNSITEYDYAMLSVLLRLTVAGLLFCSLRGITHLRKAKPQDGASLDNLVEDLKF